MDDIKNDIKNDIKTIEQIKNVFYINLDSRPDRKVHVESELKKIGLKGERFSAIFHSKGSIGCTLSHIRCIEMAKIRGLDHILIIEDDIVFIKPDVFITQFNKFLSLNREFDVILIAGNNYQPYIEIDDSCIQIKNCQTTTGYLVKSHYYDKLLENYKLGLANLIRTNISNLYCIDQYWKNLQIVDKWFLIIPLTVTQKDDYSNIEQKRVNYDELMLDLNKSLPLPKIPKMSKIDQNRNMKSFGLKLFSGRKFI